MTELGNPWGQWRAYRNGRQSKKGLPKGDPWSQWRAYRDRRQSKTALPKTLWQKSNWCESDWFECKCQGGPWGKQARGNWKYTPHSRKDENYAWKGAGDINGTPRLMRRPEVDPSSSSAPTTYATTNPTECTGQTTSSTNTEIITEETPGRFIWPSAEIAAELYENKKNTSGEKLTCVKALSRFSHCYHSSRTSTRATQTEPIYKGSWQFGLTKGNLCEALPFWPKKKCRTVDVVSLAMVVATPTDGDEMYTRKMFLELRTDPPSVIEINDSWNANDTELPIGKYIYAMLRQCDAMHAMKQTMNIEMPPGSALCTAEL